MSGPEPGPEHEHEHHNKSEGRKSCGCEAKWDEWTVGRSDIRWENKDIDIDKAQGQGRVNTLSLPLLVYSGSSITSPNPGSVRVPTPFTGYVSHLLDQVLDARQGFDGKRGIAFGKVTCGRVRGIDKQEKRGTVLLHLHIHPRPPPSFSPDQATLSP